MSNKKDKPIRITERTRETLKAIRSVNETYDDTIKRLIHDLNQAEDALGFAQAEIMRLEEEKHR